jgi:hypothetical protein
MPHLLPFRLHSIRRAVLRGAGWLGLAVALSACAFAREEETQTAREISRALSGQTLVNETGARFTLRRDGIIDGPGVAGTWWVEGRKVCRTLVAPERMAGTTCQPVTLSEDRVAFRSAGGRTLSFRIED